MYTSFNNKSVNDYQKDASYRTDFIPPEHKYIEH
jgi:hypothetical protein